MFKGIEEFNLDKIKKISEKILSLKSKKGQAIDSNEFKIFNTYELKTIFELLQIECFLSFEDVVTWEMKVENINRPKETKEYKLFQMISRCSTSFIDLCLAKERASELYRFEHNNKNRRPNLNLLSRFDNQATEIMTYVSWIEIAHRVLIYDDFKKLKDINLTKYLLHNNIFSNQEFTDELINHLILKKIQLIEFELLALDNLLASKKIFEITNSEKLFIKYKLSDKVSKNKDDQQGPEYLQKLTNDIANSEINLKKIICRTRHILESDLLSIYLNNTDKTESIEILSQQVKSRSISNYFQLSIKNASPEVVMFYDYSLLLGEFILEEQRSFVGNELRNTIHLATLDCFSNTERPFTLIPFNFFRRLDKQITSSELHIPLTVPRIMMVLLKEKKVFEVIFDFPNINIEKIFNATKYHYSKNDLLNLDLSSREIDILLNHIGTWLIDNKISQEELQVITKLISDFKKK